VTTALQCLSLLLSLVASGTALAELDARLELAVGDAESTFEVLLDNVSIAAQPGLRAGELPLFSFDYVRSGDRLLPVEVGPLVSTHPLWEYLLGVGRVVEESPNGRQRWELPVSLQERNANCIHNGWLSVELSAEGDGAARFVVSSETCQYFKWNLEATMPVRVEPRNVATRQEVIAGHDVWRSHRLPVRPLAALAEAHPDVSLEAFANSIRIAPADMTVYGLVLDGVHYRGGCRTRRGVYPDCEQLFIPSYSTAKSLFAAVALMRLEALYPGSAREPIAAHVPECRGKWNGVRLVDALGMATGLYTSSSPMADEDKPEYVDRFHLPERHAAKLDFGCNAYPRRQPSGQRWVYHTSDTYVLGTAMTNVLRVRQGAGADVFDDIIQPLWAPLELSRATERTRRTYDAVAQPFTGFGLTFLPDDLARLAVAMASGEWGASLDPQMLQAALQRGRGAEQPPQGLAAADGLFYSHGFFAEDLQALVDCDAPTWMPFMSGYGGIRVALLPRGNIYYYVSDGGVFDWAAPLRALHGVSPLC
jgi:hypothetical protein